MHHTHQLLLSKQQFDLPTAAFQPAAKQCGIVLRLVYVALVVSAMTLQLISVAPAALGVILAVFVNLYERIRDTQKSICNTKAEVQRFKLIDL
jgi:hypothetical protein